MNEDLNRLVLTLHWSCGKQNWKAEIISTPVKEDISVHVNSTGQSVPSQSTLLLA